MLTRGVGGVLDGRLLQLISIARIQLASLVTIALFNQLELHPVPPSSCPACAPQHVHTRDECCLLQCTSALHQASVSLCPAAIRCCFAIFRQPISAKITAICLPIYLQGGAESRRWTQSQSFQGAVPDNPTLPLPRFLDEVAQPSSSRIRAEPIALSDALQQVKVALPPCMILHGVIETILLIDVLSQPLCYKWGKTCYKRMRVINAFTGRCVIIRHWHRR